LENKRVVKTVARFSSLDQSRVAHRLHAPVHGSGGGGG